MKKILYLLICAILIGVGIFTGCSDRNQNQDNSSETEAVHNEGNSREIWSAEKFLAAFENFEQEIRLFIEWNKAPYSQDLENSVNEMINEKYPDRQYAVWKTYLLETEIGTDIKYYELEGIDIVYNVYLIPREMVKNTIIQLYNMKEDEIKFEEWEDFSTVEYENEEYFEFILAFGGRMVSMEILYDTLQYLPDDNIVTFDLQYYMPETEKTHENELIKLRYKFQPFIYKDSLQQYKFISVERIA